MHRQRVLQRGVHAYREKCHVVDTTAVIENQKYGGELNRTDVQIIPTREDLGDNPESRVIDE